MGGETDWMRRYGHSGSDPGEGPDVQAVPERSVREERVRTRASALPVQGLRLQLHGHAAAGHAPVGQGDGGHAVSQRAVHEPDGPVAERVHAVRSGLDRAVCCSVRRPPRADRPGGGGRAR